MKPKTNKKEITPVQEVISEETHIDTAIIPQETELVKQDADIDGFLSKRQEFIAKVNAIMVEKQDFHVIQGKKSLAKGGAEKIASIFHWTAKFEKDAEALEMLGGIEGLVAFKCTLMNGQFVGEGRGATTLQKNAGDPNKTLKMAQKSAFIDAVLRASGLSDFFTQDLEDMPRDQVQQPFREANPKRRFPPQPVQTAQELSETAKGFKKELEECNDPSVLQTIKGRLSFARGSGKFSQYDMQELAKVYEKAEKEVMPQS